MLGNLKHIIGLKEIDSVDLVTDNGFTINSLNADSHGNLTLVINGDADQSHADWDVTLSKRSTFKLNRDTALTEWRSLIAL